MENPPVITDWKDNRVSSPHPTTCTSKEKCTRKMYLLSRSIECSVSCIDGNYNTNDQLKSPSNDHKRKAQGKATTSQNITLSVYWDANISIFAWQLIWSFWQLYEVSRVRWLRTNCIKPITSKQKNGKCILACRQTEYFGFTKTPRFKLTCWKEILAFGTYHVKKEKEKQKRKVYTNRNNLISFFLAFRWHKREKGIHVHAWRDIQQSKEIQVRA